MGLIPTYTEILHNCHFIEKMSLKWEKNKKKWTILKFVILPSGIPTKNVLEQLIFNQNN